MAGHNFEFAKPDVADREIRAVLETFRRIARRHGLVFHYRMKGDDEEATIHCNVEGPLHGIQQAQDDFCELSTGYMLAIAAREGVHYAHRVGTEIYYPMIDANENAVRGITDSVFELADYFGGFRVNPYARDMLIEEHSTSRKLTSVQRFALMSFDRMQHLWWKGHVPGRSAVITFDHAFELFLKSLIGLEGVRYVKHPCILEKAEKQGLLTGMQRYRLSLFHLTRNRCQHEGYRVRRRTVDSFVEFGRDLLRKLLVKAFGQ